MFGEILNKTRKEKGISAQKMAKMLGISIRTYRYYESEHSYPPLPVFEKIADILGVSTDYLLGREHSPEEFAD